MGWHRTGAPAHRGGDRGGHCRCHRGRARPQLCPLSPTPGPIGTNMHTHALALSTSLPPAILVPVRSMGSVMHASGCKNSWPCWNIWIGRSPSTSRPFISCVTTFVHIMVQKSPDGSPIIRVLWCTSRQCTVHGCIKWNNGAVSDNASGCVWLILPPKMTCARSLHNALVNGISTRTPSTGRPNPWPR
jgi:hypothetical protein